MPFQVRAPPGQIINAIMGPWMDLNPNNGGGLYYNVYGVLFLDDL